MPSILRQQFDQVPLARQARSYWGILGELRDWWFLVLPLLAWVGWRTYRSERRSVLNARRKLQHEQAHSAEEPPPVTPEDDHQSTPAQS
jgi:hypothetical protein